MPAPRISQDNLQTILGRKGYGITCGIGKSGIQSDIKRKEILDKAGGEGEMSLVERGPRSKSVRPKDLTIPNSGRVLVSVKVFRKRLTDTGNDCWKYHLDALRYLGWLADDNDAAICLEERPHEKVKTDEEERVEITLTYEGIDLSDICKYYTGGPKNG